MQDPTAAFQGVKHPQFPEQQLKCPRCESTNTKFCYYNNYNLSQPRHFCKNCRRYWTKGGALRNIPVGGGTRKTTKRSSTSKRSSSAPSENDQTRVEQDQRVLNIGGNFSSLLASSGHFGTLLEGLNPTGSSLKIMQMGEFGEGVSSDPGLQVQSNGSSETFLGMQNGDSSCWNGSHGWSDLAIYTPGPSFQ